MKYLLHGINFAPEPTGIGKYTGEMAEWLVAQGHEVRVVTAPPYYPAWQVAAGHSAWRYRTETLHGVKVWRCPLWVPKNPGGMSRVLHLLSFAAFAFPVMLRQALWKPDIVWVCAPAFACTPGALLTAKLCGAHAWLHVQDYEVDVAFDMGLLRGSLARTLVTGLERWLLRRFDVVSSISHRMVKRAEEKGVAAERAVFFPNWVDINAITPLTRRSTYRDELGLGDDCVVALFSGTLGAKQGLYLIADAARALVGRCPQVMFVICGDGVMKAPLAQATQGLPNVRMLPLQPKERLAELLGMADIHLLPQDPDVADLVMPSKLTAMLSSGRAVLSNAKRGSVVAELVKHFGLLSTPGSLDNFTDGIERLAREPAIRAAFGEAARQFAESSLSAERVLSHFARQCKAVMADSEVTQSQGAE